MESFNLDLARDLNLLESYLAKKVSAVAVEIDSNPKALFQALEELGKLGLLALRVPRKWGGREASEETFGDFQELLARYSGALAFLQTQHQSAGGMLVASNNIELQERYLSRMGNGEVLIGVGFSQLRRSGLPLTVATPVEGGYKINGTVPWISGYKIFSEFIIAATLDDGSAVFGIVPFREINKEGRISLTSTAQLAAMTSTNTVAATLTNWFLPNECVVFIKPDGWIHAQDKNNVLKSSFLATGCAYAGLDILEAVAKQKALPFISKAFEFLEKELNDCRYQIRSKTGSTLESKLQLRAWAVDLATRIAHAAVTVSSGAAIYSHHNAQRVYREALVFTVTGQTPAVMEATLQRLIRQPSPVPPYHVIHLSHIIDTSISQWSGDPNVEFETVAEIEKDGYYLRRFSLGEHSSTHINAPKSFYEDGVGIDQYPAGSLVVPGVVIDVTQQVCQNPDYALSVADVIAWEEKHGEIENGSLVLLNTGWSGKWDDKSAFMNQDSEGNYHFPGFSRDATEFLLKERQIAGVGIDTHGIDPGLDTTFATNRLVLEKPRIVLENLTNLEQLPAKGAMIVIGVLKLQGGSGSPVGVLALVMNYGTKY